MVNDIKIAEADWQNAGRTSSPAKGNMVLVSYVYNSRENSGRVQSAKPRCIWPTSIQQTDSRYLSRRVQAKVY